MARRAKWWLLASVALALTATIYLVSGRVESEAKKSREALYQSKLREYAQQFKVGQSRRQIEEQRRARRIPFQQICCLHSHSSVFTDVVRIGEEKPPSFCSELWINVAFEFHAQPTQASDALRPDETDVLDGVSVFRQPGGCL